MIPLLCMAYVCVCMCLSAAGAHVNAGKTAVGQSARLTYSARLRMLNILNCAHVVISRAHACPARDVHAVATTAAAGAAAGRPGRGGAGGACVCVCVHKMHVLTCVAVAGANVVCTLLGGRRVAHFCSSNVSRGRQHAATPAFVRTHTHARTQCVECCVVMAAAAAAVVRSWRNACRWQLAGTGSLSCGFSSARAHAVRSGLSHLGVRPESACMHYILPAGHMT